MMPAAKHGDPQLGVDIHLCVVPPSPSPVPLPTPHMSVVFDPFDYLPYIGATVTVCGMKRATAGTNGIAVHIPPGFPFAPKLPDKDDELFMGSATVVADGDPFSHIAHPVLACQVAGMMSPIRPKKKGGPMACVLPTVFNLAIPSTVFLGGPPTISLIGMAFKAGFKLLGKFAKSGLFKRIRQKAFGFLPPGLLKCKVLRAEPVNILTGAVSVAQQDFTLPGRIPIEWVRSYASDSPRAGVCGSGWETLADTRLEVDPSDGTVSMRHPTVGPLFFPQLPSAPGEDAGELELMDGARLTDHQAEFQVRTKDDRIYHFSKELTCINPEGATEYAIRSVADLCGNWLDFNWQGDRVVGIDESAGRRIELVSERGHLIEVALYDRDTDVRHVFVRYVYDEAGDLVAVIDALDNPYRFAYDAHHLVRHTDRRGLSFYYEYEKARLEGWRVVHSWGDGGLYDYRLEYEDTLNERRITDSLGHVSLVKLDERGLPVSEVDPLGGMTIFEYDDVGRTTAVVDAAGYRTEYTYDERGNLLKLTRPDGKAVDVEFDRNRAVTITDSNGATWQQKWDARGLLLEQSTPLGNISRYEYDSSGGLSAFTNPRGARTELVLDPFGNLVDYTDALGHRTWFAHDSRGNLTEKVDPLGRSFHYAYDAKDRLKEARLPSRARIRCGYDAQDNLTLYVDENGAETRIEYFGLGEIATRTGADRSDVRYHYDTEEQLIGVVNQRGELHRFERDALGRIVKEVDYWGQTRTYTYSSAGYIQQSVDGLESAIVYETDSLGRIVKKVLAGALDGDAVFEERFEYDANGNLVSCSNPHIRIERTFDLEGRLLVETQGTDFTITNDYDEIGNRIGRLTTYKLGEVTTSHRVQYQYDLQDKVIGIAIDENPPIVVEHDAAGQVVSEQLGQGIQRHVEYSVDGHVVRQQVHARAKTVLDISYKYDPAGNLTEQRDAEFGIDRYTYDPVGRILAHLDPAGKLTRYFNDATGDRLTTTIAGGLEMPRGEGGEWSREGEYAGAFHRFDRRGTLIERRDERGTLTLLWDANERLVATRLNESVTHYRYDPLGRRVDKCGGGRRTRFAWDGDVLVADAHFEAKGAPRDAIREWVYAPDTFEPIALIAGSVFHYHRHPNGCPTRLTDGDGDVKWAANYQPGGEVSTLAASTIDNPLRFQNQYADEETGLFYNRYRYYAPSLGSFISQDPIGLFAGVNQYAYAPNPWTWIDPLGLNCAHLSNKAVAKKAKWVKARQGVEGPGLRGHFGKHGDDVNAQTAKAYDRSARETISEGRRFTYRDRASAETRVGYFNPASGLFTATSQTRKNPAILSHFPETWDNLRKLPGFSHG